MLLAYAGVKILLCWTGMDGSGQGVAEPPYPQVGAASTPQCLVRHGRELGAPSPPPLLLGGGKWAGQTPPDRPVRAHTTGSRHWAAGVLKLTWHTYRDQLCALRAVPCLAKSGTGSAHFHQHLSFYFPSKYI